MPDLLTHVIVGLSAGLLLYERESRESIVLIVLGSILIDIERPITWILQFIGIQSVSLTQGFHSILGAILLSFVVASLVETNSTSRLQRFRLVLLGTATHLLLDMTMYPWEELGLFLLFPLRLPFSFNLFWPDFMFYPLIGLGILGVSLGIVYIKSKALARIT
jgi:hypothetical protein